jgi:hypothetical protein
LKINLCLLAALLLAPCALLNARQKTPETSNSVERCSANLVPYADWPAIKDPAFALDLRAASGGRLYYFGAQHSSDPAHPQFAEITKGWDAVKPTIAFYEGPNRPLAATGEETIKQVGESGYVRFLATRDGVPFVTLEPSPREEAAHILQKYPADQALLFYVLRETARLRDRRKLPEAELKAAIAAMLPKASEISGVASFTTLEGLEAAYRRYWTSPANWWEAPQAWFDPLANSKQTGGVFTNDINRLSSEYRNLHMYTLLAKAALEGKRVFAVVGRNHVPMQAPALRCAIR